MLTIIIPSFNSEAFIRRCLNSIVTQEFISWYIFIIDGGSSDNTRLICSEFETRFPNKITFILAPHSKQGEARNIGIDLASTPYLTFIDSDDCYASDKVLSKLMDVFERTKADFLCSSVQFVDNSGRIIKRVGNFESKFTYGKEIFIDALLEKNIHTIPWNKIYKTDFLKINNIKFPDVREQEDIYFSRICAYYAKCVQFEKFISVNAFVRVDSRSRMMSLDNLTSINLIFDKIEDCISSDVKYNFYLPFLNFSRSRSLAYIIIIAASRIDNFNDLLSFQRKIISKGYLKIPPSIKLLFGVKLISIISIYISKFRLTLYLIRALKKYFSFGY